MNLEDCIFSRLSNDFDVNSFDCGNEDLNEFLREDALAYMNQLIGVTHVFHSLEKPDKIICFFTVSNDLLRLDFTQNSRKKKIKQQIPRAKHLPDYPCVKIGRLGVDKKFQGLRLAYQLMDFIKGWFIKQNRTGCRFLIVDAYNFQNVIKYYQNNDFEFLLSEEAEKEIHKNRLDENDNLKTRLMFYDLMRLIR